LHLISEAALVRCSLGCRSCCTSVAALHQYTLQCCLGCRCRLGMCAANFE
jgi:hypothetical protein